jgi:hypothetical protein
MPPNLSPYVAAARRGADWLLSQQNADGSFIRPDLQADVYHKAPLALALTGHAAEAGRLLSWIRANDLGECGRLRHFDDGLGLYKSNWICQGAHRMGRFDLSAPAMQHILMCQAPCGGFFQTHELNQLVEPVCTAWAGVSAIFTGHLDTAERTAHCLNEMLAQQPDEMRFCYHMTPEGKLLAGEGAPFVDATKPQQAYYCPGIAMLFFLRLYMATGEGAHLEAAQRLFDFSLRCADDRYSYPTAGKGAVAAALLHALTGDERAGQAAATFAEYLLREQRAEGWWCNPHSDHIIVRLDHTAEFVVWLLEITAALA